MWRYDIIFTIVHLIVVFRIRRGKTSLDFQKALLCQTVNSSYFCRMLIPLFMFFTYFVSAPYFGLGFSSQQASRIQWAKASPRKEVVFSQRRVGKSPLSWLGKVRQSSNLCSGATKTKKKQSLQNWDKNQPNSRICKGVKVHSARKAQTGHSLDNIQIFWINQYWVSAEYTTGSKR